MKVVVSCLALGLMVSSLAAPPGAAAPQRIAAAQACEELAAPGLFSDTTITLAELVSTGEVSNCRVVGTIKPTPDSNIGVEYRLPTQWNGKFLGLGGGGFGGVISANAFNSPLQRGYAAAQTNIGHTPEDGVYWPLAAPGVAHVDRVRDYAWRSHERMTVVGKEIVNFYYGQAPEYSYWQGCSTGGRQGLVMAQRFPDYYDAIIAGAPVYTTRLQARGLWTNTFTHAPGGTTLSEEQLALISNRVVDTYDDIDGVKDGVIDNPLRITDWDPGELEGVGLDAAAVDVARRMYLGPVLADGSLMYPGRVPGGETQWTSATSYDRNGISPVMLRAMVHFDPEYDDLQFNIDTDLAAWDAALVSAEGNADNPDIGAFLGRGGKLLLYHGWNDGGPDPQSTIEYYQSVSETNGAETSQHVRLFLAPGMNHCTGGVGPYAFDALSALERWREDGVAPDRIIARHPERGMERPLCPYPETARHTGTGDTNSAASFDCR
jgi:feruloyl esterase